MVEVEVVSSAAWPLSWAWRRTGEGGLLGEKRLSELVGQLLAALQEAEGDGRYAKAVSSDECIEVFSLVAMALERGAGASGAACCFPSRAQSGDARLVAIQEALEPINKPGKGMFTRRIEWSVSLSQAADVELQLRPRPGFAKWLEKDRARAARERAQEEEAARSRPKSLAETLHNALGRPKSVKETLQAIGSATVDLVTFGGSSSSEDEDEDEDDADEDARKSGSKQQPVPQPEDDAVSASGSERSSGRSSKFGRNSSRSSAASTRSRRRTSSRLWRLSLGQSPA